MPLLDGAGPPHRGLAALEAEEAGVERAMAVKSRWRPQSHAPASAVDGPHECPIGSDLGRIHERAELDLDLPRTADVPRRRDDGSRGPPNGPRPDPPPPHPPRPLRHPHPRPHTCDA